MKTTKTAKKSTTRKSTAPLPEITNYTTALRWLYDHVDYERMRIVPYTERTFSLERMRKMLHILGNPHEQIKTVHIAGTKGKGSTCAMLASMLKACGYTVGMYTSPHLVDLRERITIDDQLISHADMAQVLKLIADGEKVFGKNKPTFFEIITAAAFRYFADQAVDIAILETGLGGRLDSTNVVTPLVCGMTHISLDHTNVLGKEITNIAREKAGIFKPNIPAVSVKQEPEVVQALEDVAQSNEAPLQFTGDQIDFSYRFEATPDLGPHTRVCISTDTCRFDHLAVPLRGEHQAHNCGLALAMIDKLRNNGFNLPEEKVIEGLGTTQLAGRMEKVWAEPHVVIDGAHNAHSIKALIKSLGAHIPYDSLVMIFACGQDKDIDGMLSEVALGADKVVFTKAKSNPRAVDPDDLYQKFGEFTSKMAQTAANLGEALQLAARAVSRDDLIIVTGSFYLAGEAKKYFDNKKAKANK